LGRNNGATGKQQEDRGSGENPHPFALSLSKGGMAAGVSRNGSASGKNGLYRGHGFG
jgi:hypothetical protein